VNDYLQTMRTWVVQHRAAAAPGLSVEYHASPGEWPVRSAWATFTDPAGMGQVIVWETGACEIDIGSFDERRSVIRSEQLTRTTDLVTLLDEAADFFEGNRS
jgi:hypothetical protein